MPATPVLRFIPPLTAPLPPVAPLPRRAQPATPPGLRPSSLAMKARRPASSPSPGDHQLLQGSSFPRRGLRELRPGPFIDLEMGIRPPTAGPEVPRKTTTKCYPTYLAAVLPPSAPEGLLLLSITES